MGVELSEDVKKGAHTSVLMAGCSNSWRGGKSCITVLQRFAYPPFYLESSSDAKVWDLELFDGEWL